MKSFAVWIAAVVFGAYACLCGYLFVVQRSLIYFPVPANGSVQADDIRLDSGGESLQVWRLSAGRPRAIVYFGGNAEDVALNVPQFSRIFPQHTVYLANYRGYGASSGEPSEEALYADALRVYDHVSAAHDSVAVIGRSLGGGVATYLAANRPVERLVLVTAFDSAVSVAQAAFPIFPVSLLLRDRFDSAARAGRIEAPTLVVVAERDEIIPRRRTDALVASLDPQLVSVRVVERAGHNTIGQFPEYAAALSGFLAP